MSYGVFCVLISCRCRPLSRQNINSKRVHHLYCASCGGYCKALLYRFISGLKMVNRQKQEGICAGLRASFSLLVILNFLFPPSLYWMILMKAATVRRCITLSRYFSFCSHSNPFRLNLSLSGLWIEVNALPRHTRLMPLDERLVFLRHVDVRTGGLAPPGSRGNSLASWWSHQTREDVYHSSLKCHSQMNYVKTAKRISRIEIYFLWLFDHSKMAVLSASACSFFFIICGKRKTNIRRLRLCATSRALDFTPQYFVFRIK